MRYTARLALALGFVGAVALAGTAVGQVGDAPDAGEPTRGPALRQDDARPKRGDDARAKRQRHPGMRGGRLVHGELTVVRGDGFATVILDQGRVTAVDADARRLTIERRDGESVSVTATDRTRIRRNREQATFADIQVGDVARIVRVDTGEQTVVRAIKVRPAPDDRGA